VRPISANYTLDASGNDHVLIVDATVPGGVTISLPAAIANRVVRVKYQSGVNGVFIAPFGAQTIEGLGATYKLTQIGSEVTLIGVSGGWVIVGKGENLATQVWTATTASAWTAPAGCYFVELEGCGGGGGGAGGASGTAATSQSAGGGPGGGGAKLLRRRVPVVPGTVYDVTIGAGGAGGSATNPGSVGAETIFRVHLSTVLATLEGGGGGSTPGAVTSAILFSSGGTIAGAANNLGTTYASTQAVGQESQGGYGANTVSAVASTAGSFSSTGQSGGTAGTNGTNSGTSWGGGGGGGGGGGAFGIGQAGGNGGNGNNAGVGAAGNAGTPAAANSGGGGGGGGAGGCGTSGGAGGSGGNGGSGKLTIWWRE
jgi:hypothetical protein